MYVQACFQEEVPIFLRMGKAALYSQCLSLHAPPLASTQEGSISAIICSNQGTLGEEPGGVLRG